MRQFRYLLVGGTAALVDWSLFSPGAWISLSKRLLRPSRLDRLG